jgi:hypothetical protein
MSDPVSTSPARAPESLSDVEREARIEELLLSGLDHYFAGRYERAISVWTRIIFLDRHHDRARAYIERARSAVAERQRESEELLHDGVAAYNAGNIEAARDLLTRAVQQGSDTADLFLNRLDRADAPASEADSRPGGRASDIAGPRRTPGPQPRRGWTAAVLAGVALATVMLVSGLPIGAWLSERFAPAARGAQPVEVDPLPILTPSQAALDRARALYAGDRLREALRALDGVGATDRLKAEADRLRADIQRELLAAAGIPATSGTAGTQP